MPLEHILILGGWKNRMHEAAKKASALNMLRTMDVVLKRERSMTEAQRKRVDYNPLETPMPNKTAKVNWSRLMVQMVCVDGGCDA